MANTGALYASFFSNSLNQKKDLLQQLLAISPEDQNYATQYRNLIDQVFNHYILYYQEKAKASREDPFLFLHPPWLSAFEKTLLWLGDFKPSMIFTLIQISVKDFTPEQNERIEHLKSATKIDERHLTETMAEVQERLASQPIYSLARHSSRLIDGEVSRMEDAVEALKEAMVGVLERADALRISTAANVVEMLSPVQAIGFFAAAIDFQLKIRSLGLLRDDRVGIA